MRFLRLQNLVPLTGLTALAVVVGLALRPLAPLEVNLAVPPPDPVLAGPSQTFGTETLVGVVRDPQGVPLEGVTVVTQRDGQPIWAETDESGRFTLKGLDAGEGELGLIHDSYGASVLTIEAGSGPVELQLDAPLEPILARSQIEVADLEGQVTAGGEVSLTGFELALAPVGSPDQPGIGVPARVQIQPDGSFLVPELNHGLYEVRVVPPWASGRNWPDLLTPLGSEALRWLHPPALGAGGVLELSLVAGEVTGQAHSGETGGALAGAVVTVEPIGPDDGLNTANLLVPATRTDEEGSFRIPDLPPGRYRVRLVAGPEEREVEVQVPQGGRVDPGL